MGLLVQEIVKMGEKQLREAGIAEAKYEAEALYCFLKNIERSRFILKWAKEAGDIEMENYFNLIDKRSKRIPMQHIMGKVEFMGLPFIVRENVLIPRMDTEVVVLEGDKLIKEKDSVLDLCCGSGIIGITLAKRNNIKLTSCDLSTDAVALTNDNLEKNEVKAEVYLGNLFEPIKRKKYNLIISNPPYIKSEEIEGLQEEVKDHDPLLALDGGEDGLSIYREIIAEAPNHLKKNGGIVFEIGYDQGETVTALLSATGRFTDISVVKDLGGIDRVVIAKITK